MREPCRYGCGTTDGWIETSNGQDCVYCDSCGRHQYNAPKAETGREARTLTTIHNGIKPKLRAKIISRANARCEVCGSEKDLSAGHLLSVKDGMDEGLTELEINSSENLACMCAECNSGIGEETVPLRLAVHILKARTRRVNEDRANLE